MLLKVHLNFLPAPSDVQQYNTTLSCYLYPVAVVHPLDVVLSSQFPIIGWVFTPKNNSSAITFRMLDIF